MFNRLFTKIWLVGLLLVGSQAAQAAELASLSIQYKTVAPPCNHLGLLACALTLYINGPSVSITVTNNSSVVTAMNVTAHFTGTALNGNVDTTSCSFVSPKSSCTITFTPHSTVVPTTAFTVGGTNTDTLSATMQIIMPTITCNNLYNTGCNLVLVANGPSDTLIITNTSTVVVTNIAPNLVGTALEDNVAIDIGPCATLNPGNSCNLVVMPGGVAVPSTNFPIQSDNASTITGNITINP